MKRPTLLGAGEAKPLTAEEIRRFRDGINSSLLRRFLRTIDEKEAEIARKDVEIERLQREADRLRTSRGR